MKLGKSITFDEEILKVIHQYMLDSNITNFSLAVNEMIKGFDFYLKETKKWRTIALTVQGKKELI